MTNLECKDYNNKGNLEFLGLDIFRNKPGNIVIKQENFIKKIFHKFNMSYAKSKRIPIEPKLNLEKRISE